MGTQEVLPYTMKTLIDFLEEVPTPLSSSPTQQHSCQLNAPSIHIDAINYFADDSETDETSSSTTADSDSDSDDADSDIDENDVPYHDTSADGFADHDEEAVAQFDTTTTTTSINNDIDIDNSNHARKERSVSFGPIHVRQYERIVGDHPETKVGISLSLGW